MSTIMGDIVTCLNTEQSPVITIFRWLVRRGWWWVGLRLILHIVAATSFGISLSETNASRDAETLSRTAPVTAVASEVRIVYVATARTGGTFEVRNIRVRIPTVENFVLLRHADLPTLVDRPPNGAPRPRSGVFAWQEATTATGYVAPLQVRLAPVGEGPQWAMAESGVARAVSEDTSIDLLIGIIAGLALVTSILPAVLAERRRP
jgi:hypothetical protein